MPDTPLESTPAPLLGAGGLTCTRGDRELFSGLSFELEAGRLLQVHGANGSGKTTLLRVLCGLIRPDAGTVSWDGAPVYANRAAFARQLRYIGHLGGIKLELSPLENLRVDAALHGGASRETAERALERLHLFGFEHEPARTLSAGQRRRIALARLLLTPARLWVLDEPFTALDTTGIGLLEDLVHEHLDSGGAVVMASHSAHAIEPGRIQSLRLVN